MWWVNVLCTLEIAFVSSSSSLCIHVNITMEVMVIISIIFDLFALMGVLGNILISCVLLQKHMQNTFNKLRAALAMFDSMLLAMIVMRNILWLTSDKETYGTTFCYFFWPLQNFSQTASMFMTVAIAIERLIAISYPRKYKTNKRLENFTFNPEQYFISKCCWQRVLLFGT